MNKSHGVLLCSLVLLGMLLITVTASAQATGVDVPISGVVFNPCNGETVTFSGVDHSVSAVTFDGNGGFHSTQKDNIHVTGTGSLGNSYEGNQEDHSQFYGRVGITFTSGLKFSEIATDQHPTSK